MKVMIALPTMNTVDGMFFDSLMRMEKPSDTVFYRTESSLIYDARNRLGQTATDIGAEYMFWLDSDVVFGPDLLMRMLEHIGDRDFLSGIYFKRRPPYTPTIFSTAGYYQDDKDEIHPIAECMEEYPPETIFEIAACGFGCVLMRTEMYSTILNKRGLPFSPVLGFGEDISFCIKARECGYKLYADSSILIGHRAMITINEAHYLAWRSTNAQ